MSEKKIWNRAMVTGAVGGVLGFGIARSSEPVGSNGVRLVVGFVGGFLAGMTVGALAFGAKPKQLPRIVFGFPRS